MGLLSAPRQLMLYEEPRKVSRLFLPEGRASGLEPYVFAAGCCVLAFLVRRLLDPVMQDHSPLILFALAVAISAIRGFGPGILSTLLGALCSLYFFAPVGGFSVTHYAMVPEFRATAAYQITVFAVTGFILSWLGGELLQLRWRAVQLAAQRNEILESITDGFEAFDREWRFLYLNRAAGQLVRAPRPEVVGKKLWDETPEWRGTLVESKFREAMTNRVALHFEYLFPPSNRWLEFHVHPAGNGGITAYFSDISDRKQAELRLQEALSERDAALKNVRILSGLLPICAGCKRIRDDRGAWQPVETYISGHTHAQFSHGICPECAKSYYAELETMDGK